MEASERTDHRLGPSEASLYFVSWDVLYFCRANKRHVYATSSRNKYFVWLHYKIIQWATWNHLECKLSSVIQWNGMNLKWCMTVTGLHCKVKLIRNWYNQIPYPALKTKREITKYINYISLRKVCSVNQMDSSFPDRWSFSYLNLTKNVTHNRYTKI